MFQAVDSPYLVPFDGSFRVADAPTEPPDDAPDKGDLKERLEGKIEELRSIQQRLYAHDRWGVLLIFQAMDAAGKDGTIRAVLSGVNPAGCQVFSFKQPSEEELDHDFLWRTAARLPERGRLGIFNRSYYEEVLAVRVHPEYLDRQKLPRRPPLEELWRERLESIRDHERHLARSGLAVVKFWLNVSYDEQRKRLLKRLQDPESNWKFSSRDVDEREHWHAYMGAYEHAVNATSRPWAPWYAIPADSKPYMRLCVADVLVRALESLDPQFPTLSEEEQKQLRKLEKVLQKD